MLRNLDLIKPLVERISCDVSTAKPERAELLAEPQFCGFMIQWDRLLKEISYGCKRRNWTLRTYPSLLPVINRLPS